MLLNETTHHHVHGLIMHRLRYMLPTALFAGLLVACQGELQMNNGGDETAPEPTDQPAPTDEKEPPPFDGMIPDADECTEVPLAPGPSLARRLTNGELDNTLQTTFGVDVRDTIDEELPPDLRAAGFSNTNDALLVSLDHAEGYASVGEAVVEQLDWTAFVDARTSCADDTDDCRREFIANAAEQAFRRPAVDEEVDNYMALFDVAADEGDDFYMGAELALRAMLQSPQFLYRMEAQAPTADAPEGELRTVSSYEMASRLSYLLWHGSPDTALLSSAAADELQTPEQIEAQVERMLADPKARDASRRYVTDWLGLDGLDRMVRDPELYPDHTPARVEAMKAETLDFFDTLIWDKQAPLMSMFTAEYTVVNRDMAEFYGFANPTDGVNEYDLADDATRMGLLTQAGILALAGKSDDPSLVERGIYVFDGMLCGTLIAPPVGVTQELEEVEPGKSKRFYSQQRLDNQQCAGCHRQFDPIGFAFERYDGIGAYLTNDTHGNELRADGTFLDPNSGDQVEFGSTEDFLRTIAASDSAQDCMIKKPVQFAVGRPLLESDACMLAGIKKSFDPTTQSYQDLMRAVATAPEFRVVRTAAASSEEGQ